MNGNKVYQDGRGWMFKVMPGLGEMERLRVRNRPVDEIALRQAMEKYLREVEAK